MAERQIESDANKEIFGQPNLYQLDKPFNEQGISILYRNLEFRPQEGRTVDIYGGGGKAIIEKVENVERGYKITLKKI